MIQPADRHSQRPYHCRFDWGQRGTRQAAERGDLLVIVDKRPWQNEGFYLILTAALVVGLVLTFLGVRPIQLIFWSNILAAIIAPLLVIAILLLGNHQEIMKNQRLSLLHDFGLVLITVILITACILLFYQLATGRGS